MATIGFSATIPPTGFTGVPHGDKIIILPGYTSTVLNQWKFPSGIYFNDGNFNSGLGTYVIPIAGAYHIHAQLSLDDTTDLLPHPETIELHLYLNGASVYYDSITVLTGSQINRTLVIDASFFLVPFDRIYVEVHRTASLYPLIVNLKKNVGVNNFFAFKE